MAENVNMTVAADAPEKNAPAESSAARLNRLVMTKIQKVLKYNPEADIASLLPTRYSKRIKAYKADAVEATG